MLAITLISLNAEVQVGNFTVFFLALLLIYNVETSWTFVMGDLILAHLALNYPVYTHVLSS